LFFPAASTSEFSTLSLHDALPISISPANEPMSDSIGRANPKPPSIDRLSQIWRRVHDHKVVQWTVAYIAVAYGLQHGIIIATESDRKSTRLNSSHSQISYAVFCLK